MREPSPAQGARRPVRLSWYARKLRPRRTRATPGSLITSRRWRKRRFHDPACIIEANETAEFFVSHESPTERTGAFLVANIGDIRLEVHLGNRMSESRPRVAPLWRGSFAGPRAGRSENPQARSLVTGLEGASLRSCHLGRLLALLFSTAPYKKSVCSEDGAGKKGERHPHRKNPSHRSNQPKNTG